MQPTSNDSIEQAINQLISQQSSTVPVMTVPNAASLYTPPSVSDISSKYQEFLNRAAKDPDIIGYYQKLLTQAGNDAKLAEQYLEADYQTGTRNIVQNLHDSLNQLALTNQQNQIAQQDTLNKRGIALTQGPGNTLQYGGGGEAATEIGQTGQQYALRQEAQQRSASQGIVGAQQTLQKGLSDTGSKLASSVLGAQQGMASDVGSRASTYQSLYDAQQKAAADAAAQKAQQQALAGPKPDKPRAGTFTAVDTRQGGYRWNGNDWELVQ